MIGLVPSPFSAFAASRTLDGVTEVRRAARRDVPQPWLPTLLFGVLFVLSGVLLLAGADVAAVVLWPLAGALVMVVVFRYYRRTARRRGIGAPRGSRAFGLGCFVVCTGVAFGFDSAVAPMVLGFLGYLLLAWMQKNAIPAAVATVSLGAAVVLLVRGVDTGWAEIVYGVPLIVGGIVLRSWEEGR